MKSLLAYSGPYFDIEWFVDESGDSQALDFFNRQSSESQRKILNLFRLIGNMGKILDIQKFRNEGDKIYAFKPKQTDISVFLLMEKKLSLRMPSPRKPKSFPKERKKKP